MPDTQKMDPTEVFWSAIPGINKLQERLTCLPFAPTPTKAYTHLATTQNSPYFLNLKQQYNEISSNCVRFGIDKFPAFMPCTHSHFVNYGAGYYSYLYARMYAAQIWQLKFAKDPLSR